MGDLTRNFSRAEFACRGSQCCGHSAPVSITLVWALQELREALGQPLAVSSGFRCLTHNRSLGSRDSSQHPLGSAADVTPPEGVSVYWLAALAERIEAFKHGGIGVYPRAGFVHLDVRRGGPARWQERDT